MSLSIEIDRGLSALHETHAHDIHCLLNPNDHGGLEFYVRCLTEELRHRGKQVTWNGVEPPASSDVREIWQPRIDRLLPLMTRKPTRFLARRIAEWQGSTHSESCERSQVSHFVGTGWDLMGFPVVRKARRQNKIVTCWPAVHPGHWGDAPLDIDLYKKMDAVFTQSDYETGHLASLGVPREKMVRCGCGVQAQATATGHRIREEHALEDKKVVLFVGRKCQEKGYHNLRAAIGQLSEAGYPIVLVSIGRELDPPYPPLPSETDIDLGAADEATKQDALAACDVFALPSQAESFGIVYLEAWTYRKPVVCGIAPASRELVTRHNGGLTSDGSVTGIADAIRSLLSNGDEASKMGNAGFDAATTQYTIEMLANRHLETWASLTIDR